MNPKSLSRSACAPPEAYPNSPLSDEVETAFKRFLPRRLKVAQHHAILIRDKLALLADGKIELRHSGTPRTRRECGQRSGTAPMSLKRRGTGDAED